MPILTKAVFIDTNIWIYRFNPKDPRYPVASQIINQALLGEFPAFISDQVVREIFAVMTHPKKVLSPLSPKECWIYFKGLMRSHISILYSSQAVFANLMKLIRDYGIPSRKIHDANIVATMWTYKIPWLLTENVDDFTPFPKIQVRNPFQQ